MTKTVRKETYEEFDENGRITSRTITEETIEDNGETFVKYDYPNWTGGGITYCNDGTATTTTTAKL